MLIDSKMIDTEFVLQQFVYAEFFFFFLNDLVNSIDSADMPESVPPFMFCFLACKKEEVGYWLSCLTQPTHLLLN